MENELFGNSQNTILAGGRYDYLATQFGYHKEEGLSSIGWAAGMNRIAMILQYMQDNHMFKPEQKTDNIQMISIVSHLEKSEIEQYGKDIRLYCL